MAMIAKIQSSQKELPPMEQLSKRPVPMRKTTSILPSADLAAKPKPSVRASDDADSVCSSKSDKSRIDFHDK